MTTAATITADLILNSDSFQKGIMAATKSADSFSTKMKNLGSGMSKFGGAMTLGATLPIAAFGVSSVKSFMDAESALADLNAVLESTGGIAGVTLEQLTADAEALQKITKFSDEAVMSAQGMLLTFTNIGEDIFPQATRATLDMAEKFGMDASQAAITLGKALNDPISGVTALRRIGVMLTDEQEEQIKQFMEVGDIASAQAIIMKELAVEIGGVAEAMGDTTAGKIEQFKNQLDDVKETIGAALMPILIRLLEALVPLIEKFANASPQMQNFILIVVAVVAVIGPLIAIAGGLVTAIGAIAPVVAAVATALAPFALPIIAIIAVLALLYFAWVNNWGGIQEKFAAFVAWIKPVWDALWAGLVVVFNFVWLQIKTIWEAFSLLFEGDFRGFGEKLREVWNNAWEAIKAIIAAAWTAILASVKTIISGVIAAFTIDWSMLGKNIINGIVGGLSAGIGTVINAARSVASAASQAVRGFLGIRSPSKLMFQFGQMTAQGFADGMKANGGFDIPKALSMQSMKTNIGNVGLEIPKALSGASAINNATSETPTPAAGAGQTINIHVENPKKETAEESIARMLQTLSYTGRMATA